MWKIWESFECVYYWFMEESGNKVEWTLVCSSTCLCVITLNRVFSERDMNLWLFQTFVMDLCSEPIVLFLFNQFFRLIIFSLFPSWISAIFFILVSKIEITTLSFFYFLFFVCCRKWCLCIMLGLHNSYMGMDNDHCTWIYLFLPIPQTTITPSSSNFHLQLNY